MATTTASITTSPLHTAYETARDYLLDQRQGRNHWTGQLAASSLSTATAISTLALVRQHYQAAANEQADLPTINQLSQTIDNGLAWLTNHQNQDGGWGDTNLSYSNIATTLLVIAAFKLADQESSNVKLLQAAQQYIDNIGIEEGLRKRYGKDKTFAIPILANAALAGMVPWKKVTALPFELACFPTAVYRFLRLPVVSYAIPALVAIGQARFLHRRPRNPLTWLVRKLTLNKSLRVLQRIQPTSGGYLEAIPLTSFVTMSLAATGRSHHSVTTQGVNFLMSTLREDGSWPIDSDLATWNTSLAIKALDQYETDVATIDATTWLLSCQHTERHPYTGANPGGWGWSNLTGAVPDCDDTPAALLALDAIRRSDGFSAIDFPQLTTAAMAGVKWMLRLQNRDHGWPTFCRGWGTLPFDRSGADLTAHVLRALKAWEQEILSPAGPFHGKPEKLQQLIDGAFAYLQRKQNSDGSWFPLWFGNQDHSDEENPVYGTAKVLLAYHRWGKSEDPIARQGYQWLVNQANHDGGWGSGVDKSRNDAGQLCINRSGSGVEETALAIETLLTAPKSELTENTLHKGLEWMIRSVQNGSFRDCSPIGFYFAKLWYHECLYPVIFTVSALGAAMKRLGPQYKQN
ncbi:MAG: squalene--hopene cyclase [Planctomycetaceae bacterium]|nr:squalene--hopene cyclase [Planctomycetaceae bacterium]